MDNNHIWETSDINQVAFLLLNGYIINNIRYENNENGRTIIIFVFYESRNTINAVLLDYVNGDIFKYNSTKNNLINLIRKTKSIKKEELLEQINGT